MHFYLLNVIINHELVGKCFIGLQCESVVAVVVVDDVDVVAVVAVVGEEDVVGAGDGEGEDDCRKDQGGRGEPRLPVSEERLTDRHVPLHCQGDRHVDGHHQAGLDTGRFQ